MKKHSFILFALILILVVSVIASCENVSYPTPESSGDSSIDLSDPIKITEGYLDDLPDTDEYTGYKFTVAITEGNDIKFVSEESAHILKTAVKSRNDLVVKKYGVELQPLLIIKESEAVNTVRNGFAGLAVPDLLCFPGNIMAALANNGLLYDLTGLPTFNVNDKFHNKEMIEATYENTRLYMMYDDMTHFYDEMYMVFYNKELVSLFGLEDPSYSAFSGSWTWNKFLEYSEKVASRTTDMEISGIDGDLFGYGSRKTDNKFAQILWGSTGKKFFGDAYHSAIELNQNIYDCGVIFDALKTVAASKSKLNSSGNNALRTFTNGQLLFMVDTLDFAAALDKTDFDWGILPLPKAEITENRYYNLVDYTANMLGLPAQVSNPLRSSMILNAFSAASKEIIKNGIYNKYVNLYFRNNSSTVIFDSILNDYFIDFSVLYGSAYTGISAISTETVRDVILNNKNITSELDKKLPEFAQYVNKTFK